MERERDSESERSRAMHVKHAVQNIPTRIHTSTHTLFVLLPHRHTRFLFPLPLSFSFFLTHTYTRTHSCLRAALAEGRHDLRIELRVTSFQEMHVHPLVHDPHTVVGHDLTGGGREMQSGRLWGEGVEVWGLWWMLPGSCGSLVNVSCIYDPQGTASGAHTRGGEGGRGVAPGKKDIIRACVTVWGGPWVFENTKILSAGELAVLCSHEGEMRLSRCGIGGVHTYNSGLASSGMYVMQLGKALLDDCVIEHSSLFGIRGYHAAQVLLDRCTLRYNHRAVGIDDAAHIQLRSCNIRDNGGCVFQAVQQAARAKLILTSCVIIHTGDLWFSARRPGQVVEREGAASTPCISYSTQSISGPSFKAAPREKRKAGGQFHPGTDDLILRPDDIAWVHECLCFHVCECVCVSVSACVDCCCSELVSMISHSTLSIFPLIVCM